MKSNIIVLFLILNFGITPVLYSQSEVNKELYKSGKEKFEKGDYFNSKEELKKYIDLNITNSNPFVKLKVDKALEYNGIANFYIVDFEEALKSFLSLLNSQSSTIKVKSNIHYFLGMIKYYDAKYNYAIKEFDQVSNESDYLNDMRFYRGICKLRTYGLDNANNDFSSIYGKKYVDYKAFVLYYKGYKDEAKKELEEIAMKDNNASCFIDLAEYYALENNKIDALKNIEVAFKMGFNKPVLLYKETNFQNIIKTNEFNDLISKYLIRKPDYIIIQEKNYRDSIIFANRIKFQKDSIYLQKKINSYIYVSGRNVFLFENNTIPIYLFKYPENAIPFASVINEKFIYDYSLPISNERFSCQFQYDKYNTTKYDININCIDSVKIMNLEFTNLDQFDKVEQGKIFRNNLVRIQKKYKECYQNDYLKIDSIYCFRMKRFSYNANDTLIHFKKFDKSQYNMQSNSIKVFNINNQLNFDDYGSEFPYFNYSIGDKPFINIPISIEQAKSLIKGNEATYYEKIYTVKYLGGLIIHSEGGWASFSTNYEILSIKYNFYRENQWSNSLREFIGKPIFESEKEYEVKKKKPQSVNTISEMLSRSWVLSELKNINDTVTKKIDGHFVIRFNTNNTYQDFANNVEDTENRNKRWSLIDENGQPDLNGNYIITKYTSDKGNNRESRMEIISITNDELIIKVENTIQILKSL